jgi:predicted CopG family antitoxin
VEEVEKMGTKIISISEGVYTKLDAERWEGESFDEVITRLTKKKSLMNLVGFLKKRMLKNWELSSRRCEKKSRDRTLRIIEETK